LLNNGLTFENNFAVREILFEEEEEEARTNERFRYGKILIAF